MAPVTGRARKFQAAVTTAVVLFASCGWADAAVTRFSSSEAKDRVCWLHSSLDSASAAAQPLPVFPLASSAQAATEMLARIQQSVFSLAVVVGPGISQTGTAFIVDGSGLAVTNYHVIEGATEARAIIGGIATPIPV